jgi:hypothetical protein
MQRNCLHCGAPFKAKRATKKYCSDNCKQLAYFQRNGMMFGLNSVKPEDQVKDFIVKPGKTDGIKGNTVKPDSVKSFNVKELYVKQGNVKAIPVSVKGKESILRKESTEHSSLLSEKQIQQLFYRITQSLNVKLEKAIGKAKKELDVKYASLYGRQDLSQNTSELFSSGQIPFMGHTGTGSVKADEIYVKENSVKEINLKPDVKDHSNALWQNADMLKEDKAYFTVERDSNPESETLPYIPLAEAEDEIEQEEGDKKMSDITQEETGKEGDEEEHESEEDEQDGSVKDDTLPLDVKYDPESTEEQENERDIQEPEEKLYTSAKRSARRVKENIGRETEDKPEEQNKQKAWTEADLSKTNPEYERVNSRFIKDIERYLDDRNSTTFRGNSERNVQWVNVRLRCLIENIIRLSQYAELGFGYVYKIAQAFNSLLESKSFAELPPGYPYLETAHELQEKMNAFALANQHKENVKLRLTFKRKAELVSIRHEIKDLVPKIKFGEMDFKELHRPDWTDSHVIEEKESGTSWQDRYRQYVKDGLIDDDECGNIDDGEETGRIRKISYRRRYEHFKRTGKFPDRAA